MNVKIQYTIDLDGVPEEVKKLLPEIPSWPTDIDDIRSALEGDVNVLKIMEDIENIRKSMFMIDQRLSDCQAILEGYSRVKSGDHEPPDTQLSPPAQDIAQTLEESQKILEQLQRGALQNTPPTGKQEDDTVS